MMSGELTYRQTCSSRGAGSRLDVQNAVAAASALVVTSKREGLPTLVFEAMAQCKPVVVPNEAGCMETIADGESGFIYQQDDLEDLAARTRAALEDGARGQRARQRLLVEYDWRVVAPRLDALSRGEVSCPK